LTSNRGVMGFTPRYHGRDRDTPGFPAPLQWCAKRIMVVWRLVDRSPGSVIGEDESGNVPPPKFAALALSNPQQPWGPTSCGELMPSSHVMTMAALAAAVHIGDASILATNSTTTESPRAMRLPSAPRQSSGTWGRRDRACRCTDLERCGRSAEPALVRDHRRGNRSRQTCSPSLDRSARP
jgi:hypothetical protein